MKLRKCSEIKARVDTPTKVELERLAESLGLDASDLIRKAVRNLLTKAKDEHADLLAA